MAIAAFALCSCGASPNPDPAAQGNEDSPAVESPSSGDSATGDPVVAELEGAKFTAPPGWTVKAQSTSLVIHPPESGGNVPGLAIFDVNRTLGGNTDKEARTALDVIHGSNPDAKRMPDAKFGGVTFYHLREEMKGHSYDHYGTVIDTVEVSLSWDFTTSLADSKTAGELINQFMRTFEYDG